MILQDPAVDEPVVLHRRRRHQHDAQQRPHADQPEAARRAQARAPPRSSAACSRELAEVAGITLFLQPVQDLTVEDRVSRTQYQYTLEDADAAELRDWAPRLVERLQALPRAARRRAATSRTAGCRPTLDHRPRHGRRGSGITPADDRRRALRRLRPAAGLDHLHPAEPVPRRPGGQARVPARPRPRCNDIYVRVASGGAGAAQRLHPDRERDRAAGDQPPGPVPGGHPLLQPGARASRWARRSTAIEHGRARARPAAPASRRSFQGTAAGLPGLARQRAAADPGRARHGLHRAGRALRELHPPDHDPLDAALGRRRRAAGAAALPAPTSASSRSSASSC